MVELWTVPAAAILAAGDVGLIPSVPLAASADPPDVVLRRCRDAIDELASAAEKPNLLAVTQILTSLRYNDSAIAFHFWEEAKAMIKSPLIQELVADRARRDLLAVLETRFGRIPKEALMTRSRRSRTTINSPFCCGRRFPVPISTRSGARSSADP